MKILRLDFCSEGLHSLHQTLDVGGNVIIRKAVASRRWRCLQPLGNFMNNQDHPLHKLLENRIAIIDGAMGTTIRTYGMTEADIRGRALQGLEEGPAEQRRPVLPDAAGHDLRHPSPLPGGRSGHHRDQHLRRDQHHAERVLRG